MTLVKFNNEMMPAFNQIFDDMFGTGNFDKNMFLPKVNIKEDKEGYAIDLAAPGMKKDDFKIELDNNVLTISAEGKEDCVETYNRREFTYQAFRRSFTLPEIADAEKIKASYKDGILSLQIPKKEKAKPRAITVA